MKMTTMHSGELTSCPLSSAEKNKRTKKRIRVRVVCLSKKQTPAKQTRKNGDENQTLVDALTELTPSTLLLMRLTDQFHQTSLADLKNSSKLQLYSQLKTTIGMEKYLLDISNMKHRQALTKLRLSSHKLYIETGRQQYLAKR